MSLVPSDKEFELFLEWLKESHLKIRKFGLGRKMLFRGVSGNHKLIPKIGWDSFRPKVEQEQNAFRQFSALAAKHLSGLNSWEILFLMRHHGIPTRLLDWTESFITALYFSFRSNNRSQDSVIWVINTTVLCQKNGSASGRNMYDATQIGFDYIDYLNDSKVATMKIVPLQPNMKHERFGAQSSVFTLHFDLGPLEELYEENVCWLKLVLPKEIYNAAYYYLHLNHINEYKLFPDLEGLGRLIEKDYFL